MSPYSHLSRRLLPSSSLFRSVNSAVALFNHKMTLPPPFLSLIQLLFSKSQLLSAGDAHAIPNVFWLPQLTYDPFLPCLCLPAFRKSALELSNSGKCMHGIAGNRVHARPASYTVTKKLGQRGFEGYSAVKLLRYA